METCYCDARRAQSTALQTLIAFGSKQGRVTPITKCVYCFDVISEKGVSLFRKSSTSIANCTWTWSSYPKS